MKNTVVTFDGKEVPKSKARFMAGEWYIPGQSCFKMPDGKWHRINNGKIEKDTRTGKYMFKKELVEGIIGVKEGAPVLGFFTPQENTKRLILSGTEYPIMDDSIMESLSRYEAMSNGEFRIQTASKKMFISQLTKTGRPKIDDVKLEYSMKDYNSEYIDMVKDKFQKNQLEITDDVRKLASLLDSNITFGLEYEVIRGFLPAELRYKYGIIPTKDGSLRSGNGSYSNSMEGMEYVTLPMSGAKGLQTIHNFTNELYNRATIDTRCSLHIHFGGIRTDQMYILALYMLAHELESELFEMVPYYKKDPNQINSTKNYCKQLSSLNLFYNNIFEATDKKEFKSRVNHYFDRLFQFLTDKNIKMSPEFNRVAKKHPVQGSKWNIHSRYFWLNFVPTLFNKSETVEFRLHHPTLNPIKVVNWFLICYAIIKYAEDNIKEIVNSEEKINLHKVIDGFAYGFNKNNPKLNEYGEFVANYLKSYVRERRSEFMDDFVKKDYRGNRELIEDKTYRFEYSGVQCLTGNIFDYKEYLNKNLPEIEVKTSSEDGMLNKLFRTYEKSKSLCRANFVDLLNDSENASITFGKINKEYFDKMPDNIPIEFMHFLKDIYNARKSK